jgi:hypothetical protein
MLTLTTQKSLIMKNILTRIAFLATFSLITMLSISCTKDDSISNADYYGQFNNSNINNQIALLPKTALSDVELNGLLHMREEEKLARDVYTTMYIKYGVKIFSNIYASEQTHMDALLQLLNKYSIADPVGTNPVGVFKDEALQSLYNSLVSQGNLSILDAYKVGATIEDLDLYDLKIETAKVDNADIILVYQMLAKGSRNHMRAFYSSIRSLSGTYTPQFITQAEFDAIINSAMERGF